MTSLGPGDHCTDNNNVMVTTQWKGVFSVQGGVAKSFTLIPSDIIIKEEDELLSCRGTRHLSPNSLKGRSR